MVARLRFLRRVTVGASSKRFEDHVYLFHRSFVVFHRDQSKTRIRVPLSERFVSQKGQTIAVRWRMNASR